MRRYILGRMWIFGKKDKKVPAKSVSVAANIPALSSKEEKVQALLAQMRVLRAEIGEENLQALANKLRLDAMKQQMRDDIDTNPAKRAKLLDELRWQAQDDGKPPKR